MGIEVKLEVFEGPLDLLLHLIDKNKVDIYDIPIANNRASADFMIHSEFMNEEYEHEVINFKKNIKERSETL